MSRNFLVRDLKGPIDCPSSYFTEIDTSVQIRRSADGHIWIHSINNQNPKHRERVFIYEDAFKRVTGLELPTLPEPEGAVEITLTAREARELRQAVATTIPSLKDKVDEALGGGPWPTPKKPYDLNVNYLDD